MVRLRFCLAASLALTSLALAQSPSLIRLQAGKNPEGITVNPVTHKAYVAAEVDDPDRKVVLVFDSAALNGTSAPKAITIANETEYLTVDPIRNRIYLSTKYGIKSQDVETGGDDETGEDGDDDDTGGIATEVILGTLTVIDGNTDTVIATYQFPAGVEPEGVAVDVYRNIVYVGTKAPEPEPENGTCPAGIFFIDSLGDEECWTAGTIHAFRGADITTGPVKVIPAGDDPEAVVFVNDLVYAANEDDGTVTIAHYVNPDGSGGELVTDTPRQSSMAPPYSLGVFYGFGPNMLACTDKRYETDKMTVGWDGSAYSVYITDDRSRVAKIQGARVVGETAIPIDPILGQCSDLSNGNESGQNTANNIAFMQTSSRSAVYVVSEQDTVAMLDPLTLALRAVITVPGAVHLDAVGVDASANRIWITDEDQMAVFVLQGACVDGSGPCVAPASVATPVFSPPPGLYTQPVTISSTTPGAMIRYTLDGNIPSETQGTLYTGAITLTGTATIKAIAYATGYAPSPVVSAAYLLNTPGSGPSLVQSNATSTSLPNNSSQSVAFTSAVTAGNTIFVFSQYYGATATTTASDNCGDLFQEISGSPATNRTGEGGAAHWFIARNVAGGACTVRVSYSSPTRYGGLAVFEVSGLGGANVTLDRFANGSGNGSTASVTLTPAQASSFAIAQVWSNAGGGTALGGAWTTQERTRFSTLYQSNLAGWQVLNSNAPAPLSVPVTYGPWIAMVANFSAKGSGTSNVAAPTFSPAPGAYTQPVVISTITPGASIRYTTDGSTPTSTYGAIYSGPVVLTANTTIKAIAYRFGYPDSAVATGTYTMPVVQSNAVASSLPNNSTQSVAFQSAVTAGNTIFVFAQYYGAAATAVASDNCGDVFQEITGSPVVNTSGGRGAAHWFIAKNVAGGLCTVRVSYSSPTHYGGVAIFEVAGLGGANVTLDRYASGSGTGATASAMLSPSRPGTFAIAQVWSDGGGGNSLGGNWTTQERTRFSTLYQSNLAGWQVLPSISPASLSVPVQYGPWIAMIANFYAQ